ncbi:MAG: hypothetical protein WB778_07430 [Thermoplasmata archaeon]
MGNIALAEAIAIFATATEIGLVVFGFPLVFLVVIGLGLFATDLLLIAWHPAAVLASMGTYIFSAIIGVTGFSILGLIASMV